MYSVKDIAAHENVEILTLQSQETYLVSVFEHDCGAKYLMNVEESLFQI